MSTSGSSSGAAGGLLAANNLSDVASRQTSLNNLAGATTSGAYLRGTGTNIALSTIQTADVPTLNQNTTGTAGGLSANIATSQVTGLDAALAARQSTTLTNAHILVGNGSNVATDVDVTGDITITNAGVTAIGNTKVTNAMLAGSIDLAAKVTGILPIANGGTGASVYPGSTLAAAVAGHFSTGAFLGLDYVGTEYGNQTSSIDLRSIGGTAGAETATPSGSVMAGWHVGGWGTTAGIDCAQIYCRATQVFSDTQSGCAWDIYITPNGSVTKAVAVTIDQSKAVTCNGTLTITGALAGVTTLAMAGAISGATNIIDISVAATNATNVVTAGAGLTGMRAYVASPTFQLERSDGNSGAGTPVLSGEALGAVQFGGATTSAANPTIYGAVQIRALATENFSGTLGGTKLELRTTPNGTHTRTTAVTIDQDQSVTCAAAFTATGAATCSSTLALNGTVTIGEAINIVCGTTTGTKFGTGTTQKIGFYNATPVVQQTDGAGITNNVTSGGTTNTIANFTDLTIYANDAAAIRNDIYQLARKMKIVDDALRTLGLLS